MKYHESWLASAVSFVYRRGLGGSGFRIVPLPSDESPWRPAAL